MSIDSDVAGVTVTRIACDESESESESEPEPEPEPE